MLTRKYPQLIKFLSFYANKYIKTSLFIKKSNALRWLRSNILDVDVVNELNYWLNDNYIRQFM